MSERDGRVGGWGGSEPGGARGEGGGGAGALKEKGGRVGGAALRSTNKSHSLRVLGVQTSPYAIDTTKGRE